MRDPRATFWGYTLRLSKKIPKVFWKRLIVVDIFQKFPENLQKWKSLLKSFQQIAKVSEDFPTIKNITWQLEDIEGKRLSNEEN